VILINALGAFILSFKDIITVEPNIREILANNIKNTAENVGFHRTNWLKKPEFQRHFSP